MPPTPDQFRHCIVLTGPTGSGKTALAIELALHIGAEIIAADSMTLYRGMDIGTAKPTLAERRRVPHHLIDLLQPSESANVAWWLQRAAECVADIHGRGRKALIVGGTPLYLKAMLFGLFESPPADAEVRRRLEAEAERDGLAALHGRLASVDPIAGRRLHINDVRRVVRALEVFELTGQPISVFQRQWGRTDQSGLPGPPLLCIDLPRDELYARIDQRVLQMIEAGWIDEVAQLRGQALSREAVCALGYAELCEVLSGRRSLADAIATIQLRSRQFAKRQLTWFRNWPGIRWVRPELTLLHEALTISGAAGG